MKKFLLLLMAALAPGSSLIALGQSRRGFELLATYLAMSLLTTQILFAQPIGFWLGIGAIQVLRVFSLIWTWQGLNLPRLSLEKKKAYKEVALYFSIFLAAEFSLRLYGPIDSSKMPSASMCPTILMGDTFSAKSQAHYSVGDIVVFIYPRDPNVSLVKRIIGLPGQRVRVKNNQIFIDDQPLIDFTKVEPVSSLAGCIDEGAPKQQKMNALKAQVGAKNFQVYLPDPLANLFLPDYEPAGPLGADEYFVLGDNIANSSDSRVWGPLKGEAILGKVSHVYWNSEVDGRFSTTVD